MSRTLASQLPDLRAALRRAAVQHAPRWLSESWEAASGQFAHPSRTAGNAVQSRHAAGIVSMPESLGSCQQRAHASSRPLGLSLRHGSASAQTAGMSHGMMTQMTMSRLLLTSTLVPAAHVMHSVSQRVSAPTGCASLAGREQCMSICVLRHCGTTNHQFAGPELVSSEHNGKQPAVVS